ncbi:hypothetical protein GCM10020258_11920 [Sphingomonas yabuuchiae]
MQVLSAKGLVESRPKTGTRVLPRSRWNLLDPDVLAWAFSGEPDIHFVRSLFELRAIVEPAAARLAAERRDKTDLKDMRDALGAMRRHTLATDAGGPPTGTSTMRCSPRRATTRWSCCPPASARRSPGPPSSSSGRARCPAIRCPTM